jgi:aminoglycoside phosphotransferase (APT) family kinase protein
MMPCVLSIELPMEVAGVDAAWLQRALRTRFPDVDVRDMRVRQVQFSTATRVLVDVEYGGDAPAVPAQLCVKGGFDCAEYDKRAVTFRHEARAYGELLPLVPVRRPASYFEAIDESNGQGVVILEDIVAAGGTPNRALDAPTVDGASDYLDTLATMHAGTWDAPFLDRLPWLTVSLSETDTFRHWWDEAEVEHYLDHERRAEVVDPALHDPRRLVALFDSLAPFASRRPRSVLHGDAHIGNTYRDAAGGAAFLDWQGVTQGPWVRDVSYFMGSNLTIADRRAHERDLLRHYLDRLAAHGVEPPSWDDAWTEYRRWLVVPLLVWIRNSDLCQPRGSNRLGAQRSSTAVMDLDVLDLFA